MRLFVALDFDEHKDYFVNLQERLGPFGRFTFPRSFHLTLKFLGEVPDAKLAEVKSALAGIKFRSFGVKLGSLGVFPSQNYMRVVWVGVEPADAVGALQRQIDLALGNPDKRFHPHITLARVKDVKDRTSLTEFLEYNIEEKRTNIDSFCLVKSTLSAQGPIYEFLYKFAESKDI
jgi:2'-5' RNA ligase